MKDNTSDPQAGPDVGWNSESPVLGGIPCRKAAMFMDSFIGIYRILGNAKGPENNDPTATTHLSETIANALSALDKRIAQLRAENDPRADEFLAINIAAICQAGVVATGVGEPYDISNLSENAINTVIDMVEKNGGKAMANGIVRFGIKPGRVPGSMVVGAALMPIKGDLTSEAAKQNPDNN